MPADPSKSNEVKVMQGKLLLADPSLQDGCFHRSVVLITSNQHDEGATGLILNKPSGRVVGDVLKAEQFAPLRLLPVYHGGPVMNEQLTFSSFWWSRKIGLRWACRISAEEAANQTAKPGRIVRAFVGYAGWSPGQLESELSRKSWFTLDPARELLGQAQDTTLWATLMRGISPFHHVLSMAPNDPFTN